MAKTPGQERFRRRQKELQKEIVKGKSLKGAKVAVREKQEGELQREIAGSPKAIAQRSENIESEKKKITEESRAKIQLPEQQEEIQEKPSVARAVLSSTLKTFEKTQILPPVVSKITGLPESVDVPVEAKILGAVGGTAAALLSPFSAAATTLGAIYAIDQFILSPSELATWAAVDNIASATSFQVNAAVRETDINDPEDLARTVSLIQQAERNIQQAESFVNFTTMRNPKLWPNRDILKTAVDVAKETIQLQKQNLGL